MTELLGWVAAGLTLLTFACTEMRRLRLLALGANFAFVAYASQAELWPVLALHLTLIPINLWRLLQARPQRERGPLPARRRAPAACVEGRARRRRRPACVFHPGATRPTRSAVRRTTHTAAPPRS